MLKVSHFCLEKIFFWFSISKQNKIKVDEKQEESLEIHGLYQNASKNKHFFAEYCEKFNKWNFLFDNYWNSTQKVYND